jgi:hypothetical protein
VSLEDDECSGQPSTNKTTENVYKIWELIREDCRQTIQELADTTGISYGDCEETLSENLNTRRIAPSSQRTRPHVPETTEYVTNNNMVIVSHPPYLPD